MSTSPNIQLTAAYREVLGAMDGRLELNQTAQLAQFVWGLQKTAPRGRFASPQDPEIDPETYVFEAQNIHRTIRDGGDESWRTTTGRPNGKQYGEQQTLIADWKRHDAAYLAWDYQDQMGVRTNLRGARRQIVEYLPGSLEMVAGTAALEARANFAVRCRRAGTTMLQDMVQLVDLPDRHKFPEMRKLMKETAHNVQELPYESTLPDFWRMPRTQQKAIVDTVGKECLELWKILAVYGDTDQMEAVYLPYIDRPIRELKAHIASLDNARKANVISAFLSTTAWHRPYDESRKRRLTAGPPIRDLYDVSVAALEPLIETPPEASPHLETMHDAVLNMNVGEEARTPKGERLKINDIRDLFDQLTDASSTVLYKPQSHNGLLRKLRWDPTRIEAVDFAPQLCGKRPIEMYDFRVTRLAAKSSDLCFSTETTIPEEDIHLYRVAVTLKSTGKRPLENALHIAVWVKPVKGGVQVRKKALDKKAAAEVIARHNAESAQTARRSFTVVGSDGFSKVNRGLRK